MPWPAVAFRAERSLEVVDADHPVMIERETRGKRDSLAALLLAVSVPACRPMS
jgi:hypothetical protein